MKSLKKLFLRGAENIAAAMLAVMFFTFLLQIVSRYILEQPFGWTLELCLTLWIWIIFWGNAFVVRHNEHVTFDVVYYAVKPKTRRIFSLVGAAAIIIGMVWALYPTWDWIDFLKIKKSATMRIPMRTVFSIFAVFMVASAITYAYRFYITFRYGIPEELTNDEPENKTEIGKS